MHSMTGYGKGTAAANGKTVTVELKTVNHKFFDWSMKMPKGFLFLEDSAKKTVAGKVARGHIDVFVGYDCESGALTEYRVDKELAAKFAAAAREVADAAGVECDLSVSDLVRNADILSAAAAETDEEELGRLFAAALDTALDGLVAMRKREGESLRADISSKLDSMRAYLDRITALAPEVVADYREKLTARIKELLGESVADMSRVATEVALFADRCAIDEEISRLGAHIENMRALLSDGDPVGRKLDFLVQEMNRETNTIGSKANDLRITECVLALKGEIEKIREQAQNVE